MTNTLPAQLIAAAQKYLDARAFAVQHALSGRRGKLRKIKQRLAKAEAAGAAATLTADEEQFLQNPTIGI